jgi:methyl-accepting chemotaxis protein
MFRLNRLKLAYQCLFVFLLVGVLPLLVVGIAALKTSKTSLSNLACNQLISIRDIKKNQVLRYLQTINDQMLTFSEDRMVVAAMREFAGSFNALDRDNHYSDEDIQALKAKLATYYHQDFSAHYAELNNGRRPDADRIVSQLDKSSIVAQYHYIKANPHPLGSKETLDRAPDSSHYSQIHAQYHPIIRNFLKKFGYYDIFLVDPQSGDIVYSVFKELDYSTSLIDGPYARTNFAEAFRLANQATRADAVFMVDFKPYLPSYEAPAGFLAAPIFDGQEKIGVALFQFPIDTLNTIMGERSGMGRSGETYLVGPDRLMRSDSYLDPEHHSVTASFQAPDQGKVDTEASQAALKGGTDATLISDYNGNPVLSAYAPVAFNGLNWALLAEIDAAEAFAPQHALFKLIAIVLFCGVTAVVVVALLFTRSITRPIAKGVDFAKAMSAGDLTQSLEIRREDEVGILATALNTMADNLKKMFADILKGVETLASSSTELSAISQQMASGAEQTAGNSNQVAAASEQMNANMNSVAAASEQASTNVQMVAAAAEQMSATINEITGNTAKGHTITDQAVHQAKSVSSRVADLGRAASEVGKVTETINEISEQTNLLALNATIEAARAGEAGKGFAVVANEIKELAKQTAEATHDIRLKIDGIQGSTEGAVTEIKQIEAVIVDINSIVSSIAAALEEQSTSTQEIAGNINQAARGIQDVNENVVQSSTVSAAIAKDISEVNQAAAEMAQGSQQANQSAEALSRLAEELQAMVTRFRL